MPFFSVYNLKTGKVFLGPKFYPHSAMATEAALLACNLGVVRVNEPRGSPADQVVRPFAVTKIWWGSRFKKPKESALSQRICRVMSGPFKFRLYGRYESSDSKKVGYIGCDHIKIGFVMRVKGRLFKVVSRLGPYAFRLEQL